MPWDHEHWLGFSLCQRYSQCWLVTSENFKSGDLSHWEATSINKVLKENFTFVLSYMAGQIWLSGHKPAFFVSTTLHRTCLAYKWFNMWPIDCVSVMTCKLNIGVWLQISYVHLGNRIRFMVYLPGWKSDSFGDFIKIIDCTLCWDSQLVLEDLTMVSSHLRSREKLQVNIYEDSSEASYQVAQELIDHIRRTSKSGDLKTLIALNFSNAMTKPEILSIPDSQHYNYSSRPWERLESGSPMCTLFLCLLVTCGFQQSCLFRDRTIPQLLFCLIHQACEALEWPWRQQCPRTIHKSLSYCQLSWHLLLWLTL